VLPLRGNGNEKAGKSQGQSGKDDWQSQIIFFEKATLTCQGGALRAFF
jgi:hypothetical protein